MKTSLFLTLVLVSLCACQKENPGPESDSGKTCRITSIRDSIGDRLEYTFEYDNQGRIARRQRYSIGEEDLLTIHQYGFRQGTRTHYNSDGTPYRTPQRIQLNGWGFISVYIETPRLSLLSDGGILGAGDTTTYSYNLRGQLTEILQKSTLFFTDSTTRALVRKGKWKFNYEKGNLIKSEYTWSYPDGFETRTTEYFYRPESPELAFTPIENWDSQTRLFGNSRSRQMPFQWRISWKNSKGEEYGGETITTTVTRDERGAPVRIRFLRKLDSSPVAWPSTKIYTCHCD